MTEHGFIEDLVYEIASVHTEDEGYYLCIGGLNGVPRMRWQQMYLAVKNCRGKTSAINGFFQKTTLVFLIFG